MVTVIIPTLNEEENIGNVIRYIQKHSQVTEVLVVDDKSMDNTVSIAKAQGAKVITSTKLGKGASMKDGILCAKNEILAFLDGDIDPYPTNTLSLLINPILNDEADFVKSSFSRNAGRVTELVAKPLLSIFFNDLLQYNQPLSGMIAGKKELFKAIDFSDDYGVDIGILIDMYLLKVRIKEVIIGYIENNSKPWQELGKMSKEVAQTIISKAASTQNPNYNFEQLGIINEIRNQMDLAISKPLLSLDKLIAFDMDNTILQGRFIDTCAKKFGFEAVLQDIRASEQDGIVQSKQIANLLKGKQINELLEVLDEIPIVSDAQFTVEELIKRGFIVGIISDSYDFVTNHIKNKLGMHFALSNELEFSKSICTGEMKIPSFFFNNRDSICKHSICKTNALLSINKKYHIMRENTIAIGDSINDLCMIREAGVGVAFNSKDGLMNYHADIKIEEQNFAQLLQITN